MFVAEVSLRQELDDKVAKQMVKELKRAGVAVKDVEWLPDMQCSQIHLDNGMSMWTGNMTSDVVGCERQERRQLVTDRMNKMIRDLKMSMDNPTPPNLDDPEIQKALRLRIAHLQPVIPPLTTDYARNLAGLSLLLCIRREDSVAIVTDQLLGDALSDTDHLFDIARANMKLVPHRIEEVAGGWVIHGESLLIASLLPRINEILGENDLIAVVPRREAIVIRRADAPPFFANIPQDEHGFPHEYWVNNGHVLIFQRGLHYPYSSAESSGF